MMSRPLASAPRKKRPWNVGPIGMPSNDTTSVSLPSIRIWSDRWFVNGPLSATWFAQRGAARQAARMKMRVASEMRPAQLRRIARQACRHTPAAAEDGTAPPAAGAPTSGAPAVVVGFATGAT